VFPGIHEIATIAGTGARGYSGDGGLASEAVFNAPKEMALDAEESILIVDTENHVIRRIDARSWIVTTRRWSGTQGRTGAAARCRRRTGRRDLHRRFGEPPDSQADQGGLSGAVEHSRDAAEMLDLRQAKIHRRARRARGEGNRWRFARSAFT
jgi:hypothetical protein